jgi:hypothetical protein
MGDHDPARVTAEVTAEVDRRVKAGVYPAELRASSAESRPLRPLLDNLVEAARFSVDPPLSGGRLAVIVKRAMLPGLRWYGAHLLAQQEAFAAAVVAVVSATVARVEELERRLPEPKQ